MAESIASRLPNARRACHECNRKKTRCDRHRPACGLCIRTNTRCDFPVKRKARGSRRERAASQSHGVEGNLKLLLSLLQSEPKQWSALVDSPSPYSTPVSETQLSPAPEPGVGPEFEAGPAQARFYSRQDGHDVDCQGLPGAVAADETLSGLRTASASCSAAAGAPVPEPEESAPPDAPSALVISYALAMELLDLFFDRIQPWMPLLHKPSFRQDYARRLQDGGQNCLDRLGKDEALLLYSIFAISARFSTFPSLKDIPVLHRGDNFGKRALRLCGDHQGIFRPSITYLQGCTVLAFYFYSSGLSTQGWMLAGICGRLAYELELSDLDEDDYEPVDASDWVLKEGHRRLWWLVWELDTFGSTVCKRPFAIDRHRISIMLPVSDEVWFARTPTPSARLLTCPSQTWKTLQGSQNQDERAWHLLAVHLMSLVTELHERKVAPTAEEKQIIENGVSCFKFALPAIFNEHDASSVSDPSSIAKSNWIIGTQLMMAATCYRLGNIQTKLVETSKSSTSSTYSHLRARVLVLSHIARHWTPEHIAVAHPFFTCSLLPAIVKAGSKPAYDCLLDSYNDVLSLILSLWGQSWKLASLMLCIARFLNKSTDFAANELELAKRYPVYFPRWITNIDFISSPVCSTHKGTESADRASVRNASDLAVESGVHADDKAVPPGVRDTGTLMYADGADGMPMYFDTNMDPDLGFPSPFNVFDDRDFNFDL